MRDVQWLDLSMAEMGVAHRSGCGRLMHFISKYSAALVPQSADLDMHGIINASDRSGFSSAVDI